MLHVVFLLQKYQCAFSVSDLFQWDLPFPAEKKITASTARRKAPPFRLRTWSSVNPVRPKQTWRSKSMRKRIKCSNRIWWFFWDVSQNIGGANVKALLKGWDKIDIGVRVPDFETHSPLVFFKQTLGLGEFEELLGHLALEGRPGKSQGVRYTNPWNWMSKMIGPL